MFAFCRELSIIAPFSLVKTDIGFIFYNNSTKVQHVDDFSCAIYMQLSTSFPGLSPFCHWQKGKSPGNEVDATMLIVLK